MGDQKIRKTLDWKFWDMDIILFTSSSILNGHLWSRPFIKKIKNQCAFLCSPCVISVLDWMRQKYYKYKYI